MLIVLSLETSSWESRATKLKVIWVLKSDFLTTRDNQMLYFLANSKNKQKSYAMRFSRFNSYDFES